MTSQHIIDLEEKYGAHNYKPLDVVLTRGEGVWLYDVEGKRYLDCLSAYSAVSQGHVHPEILKTLHKQAEKLTLTSRAFRHDQLGPLYAELAEITGYEMFLLMNTGVEAVETAFKLARKWAYQIKKIPRYQAEIIVVSGNFHGRTITDHMPRGLFKLNMAISQR
jgi:ornithine--oxo-acid transaminase